MKISEYIKLTSERHLKNYQEFYESVKNDDDNLFRSVIFDIGNYIIILLKKIAVGQNFHALINEAEAKYNNYVIEDLHHFRIIRNKIIHDETKNYIIGKEGKVYIFTIFQRFLRFFASRVDSIEDFEICDTSAFYESQKQDEVEIVNEYLEYYNNVEKSQIEQTISDEYTPEIDLKDININHVKAILDFIFDVKHNFASIISKYNFSGSQFNDMLKVYGFKYDWIEFLKFKIRTIEVFEVFIGDFFSQSKKKSDLLFKMIEIYLGDD